MAAFVSTFTDIGLINTTMNPGTITLPSTTQIPYRQLIFKDAYGNVPNKFLTLSTQGGDVFEDGRSTRVLKDAYGFTTLYGYNGTWYFLGGTTQNATTISSLTVSTINNGVPIRLTDLQSTIQGLGSASFVSSSQLTSTLGNFVSTLSLLSTVAGLNLAFTSPQNISSLTMSTGSLRVSSINATILNVSSSAFVSSLIVNSLQFGDGTGWVNVGPIQTVALSSIQINTNTLYSFAVSTQQLNISSLNGDIPITRSNVVSTVQGLGSSGYISTLSLLSTVGGLQSYISSFIDPTELASSVLSFISTGYLTTQLTSTVTGLGSSRYISSAQLISTTAGLIDIPEMQSTIQGLGSSGYISSLQLLSTVGGLQTYISSFIDPAELASSVLSFISTGYLTSQLTSTVTGLGSATYISSPQLLSTSLGLANSIQAAAASVTAGQLTSTTQGLGSSGYISSLQLLSTVGGLQTYISSFIDPVELASSVLSFISTGYLTSQLTSTVTGLGSATYISSPQLLSTSLGLANSIQAAAASVTAGQLTSTTQGLGSLGYISSLQLLSTVGGLQTYISSFIDPVELASSVLSFISTGYLTSQLTSTVTGLGTTGYVSTLSLYSTVRGLGTAGYASTSFVGAAISTLSTSYASSFFTVRATICTINTSSILFGIGDGYLAMPDIQPITISTLAITTSSIVAQGLGQFISLSTLALTASTFNGAPLLSFPTIVSTVAGLGSSRYISSAQLVSTVGGLTSFIGSSISSFSTAFGPGGTNMTTITSTVQGLGSSGYISSLQLLSTVGGLQTYISSFIDPTELASSVLSFISTGYLTTQLTSTVRGLGSSGYISTLSNVPFISVQTLIASSIGINCNSPYFQLDIFGAGRAATFLSTPELYSSSFRGNLGDAQTVILWEV